MRQIYTKFLTILLLFSLVISCNTKQQGVILVKSISEFNNAVSNATPGTLITLANGVWKNVELILEGKGTEENPITLTVEEKGKVTLEGASNLQIAGEHLIIDGLVFKNGFTPTNAVISFRKNKQEIANNTRLTACAIDNYNNPERHVQDYWITIYGKNNRIDHNHISGKKI